MIELTTPEEIQLNGMMQRGMKMFPHADEVFAIPKDKDGVAWSILLCCNGQRTGELATEFNREPPYA